MRLGLIVYLTCVFSTADAGQLQIDQAANEDFVAQMHGVPGVRIDELALEIDGTRLVTPWKIGAWQRYGAPVAVTLLVQGTEHWIGTDKLGLLHDEDVRPGVLPGLAVELDRLNFHVLPHGSRMATATYSDRVVHQADDSIAGWPLRTQKDYLGNTRSDLSDAIEAVARGMYQREPHVSRRVIVVLGDGCDDDDADEDRRRALRGWLDGWRVELHAVVYKSTRSCGRLPIRELTAKVTHVTTVESLAAAAHRIVSTLDDRTYAHFDGAKLPWDGEPHAYVVIAGEQRFGPVFRTLPDRREHTDWTWWLIASALLLALIALPFVIRRWHRSAGAILR